MIRAIFSRVSRSGGTSMVSGIPNSLVTSIVPLSVPRAIVYTGTRRLSPGWPLRPGRGCPPEGAVGEEEDDERRLAVFVVLLSFSNQTLLASSVASATARRWQCRRQPRARTTLAAPVCGRRSGEPRLRFAREGDEPDPELFGHLLGKRDAAVSAASSRVGSTSVARIEPETSIASTTDAWLRGTFVTSWGRGREEESRARPETGRAGPAAPARRLGDDVRQQVVRQEGSHTASAAGPGRDTRASAGTRVGAPRGAGGKRSSPRLQPSEEPGVRAATLSVERTTWSAPDERIGKLGALGRGPLTAKRSRSSRLFVRRGRPRRRSDTQQDVDELARAGHGSRDRARPRAPSCSSASSSAGVEAVPRRGRRASRASPGRRARASRGGRSRRRRPPRFLAERGQECREAREALLRGQRTQARAAKRRSLPRRGPHCRSRGRHLGDVGLPALGRSERHGGRDVEDEPGRHVRQRPGRASARPGGRVPVDEANVVADEGAQLGESVPSPRVVARCSPETSASTRRRRVRSRARRSASGMGPGPGRAGVRTWAEPVMRRYPWRGRSREPDRLDYGVEDLVGRHLAARASYVSTSRWRRTSFAKSRTS